MEDRSAVGLIALLAVAACAGSRPAPPPFPVPAMADGPLEIRIVYPPPQLRGMAVRNGATFTAASSYTMPAVDSVFLLGSVGRGDASLTVNGRPVDVYPTGAWLAWLPRPEGDTARFHLTAWTDSDTAQGTFTTAVIQPFSPPPETVWIDSTAFVPAGELWVRPGEGYRLSARAPAGAVVRAILGDGDTLQFQPASPRSSRAGSQVSVAGAGAGATPTEKLARQEGSRYVAWHVGRFGPDPGHVMSPTWRPLVGDSSWVTLEVIRQADTARSRWPLRVGIVDGVRPPLALVADDTAGTGATDRVLAGRPVPFGTYHWFFPNGTVIPVSGRSNAQVRLQLSRQSVAWVDVSDVLPLRPGTPLPRAVAGSMRLVSDSGSVTLRVPLSRRVPFRVDETEQSLILRLYSSAADMDWIRYGGAGAGAGPFVRLISFHQPAEDEVEIRIDLDQPVWGYRTRWSGNALLLQIRRPPAIGQGQGQGQGRPFSGRRIAIDAGHPPAGSRGPTGITEAEVTLAVSRKLRSLLEERGAEVVMIRDSESAIGLIERTEIAERSDAELLVSIHANALADGANPFVSSGTTVFYYHPRSVGLARGINDALVRQLGFRDLGVARGDLHLARPTWMPAVLVEGLFMMIPEHEAVLLSEEGQWRYAHGVLEGIGSFLEERAGGAGR